MRARFVLKSISLIAVLSGFLVGLNALSGSGSVVSAQHNTATQGSLQVIDPNGKPKAVCPLKHTEVKAEISGFLVARDRHAGIRKSFQGKDRSGLHVSAAAKRRRR